MYVEVFELDMLLISFTSAQYLCVGSFHRLDIVAGWWIFGWCANLANANAYLVVLLHQDSHDWCCPIYPFPWLTDRANLELSFGSGRSQISNSWGPHCNHQSKTWAPSSAGVWLVANLTKCLLCLRVTALNWIESIKWPPFQHEIHWCAVSAWEWKLSVGLGPSWHVTLPAYGLLFHLVTSMIVAMCWDV